MSGIFHYETTLTTLTDFFLHIFPKWEYYSPILTKIFSVIIVQKLIQTIDTVQCALTEIIGKFGEKYDFFFSKLSKWENDSPILTTIFGNIWRKNTYFSHDQKYLETFGEKNHLFFSRFLSGCAVLPWKDDKLNN